MNLTALLLAAAAAAAPAARTYRNPILDRIGPADPHVIRHEGMYYLYPTMDTSGYDVFTSTDLVHWAQGPRVFTAPRGGAWAPDVFRSPDDGRCYLMYSGSGANSPDYAVGYATARSPRGPFAKYEGNPIGMRGGGVLGPGHHCVVAGPDGRRWMVYHQKKTVEGDWDRFLAIDPLWFDTNGVIHVRLTRGTDEPAP